MEEADGNQPPVGESIQPEQKTQKGFNKKVNCLTQRQNEQYFLLLRQSWRLHRRTLGCARGCR